MNTFSPLTMRARRPRLSTLCIATLFLFVFTGCTSMQVKFGWKVYLERTPITSMDAKLEEGPAIGPGQKAGIVVTLTRPNGKTLATKGADGGKVMWKELRLTSSVVAVNKNGVVSLPKDPRISDGKMGHVIITVPSHPDLRADLDIPFRYDISYFAGFSGSSGFKGADGASGMDGTSGSSGSTDPNHPSPGGNGSDGSRGSDGSNGSTGGNAPTVTVKVALQSGVHPLLQISVSAGGKETLYLVDPHGGSLTVRADGGEGGAGGKGGRGGRGGSGGIGSPNGSSGHDGSNGHDGSSGSPGRGGLITVIYDPQAKPFLNTIRLYSAHGPSPVFREESIATLW
jgi:hypothetical protein